MNQDRVRENSGASLVELLVASVILVVILSQIVMMFQMLSRSQTQVNLSHAANEVERGIRLGLELPDVCRCQFIGRPVAPGLVTTLPFFDLGCGTSPYTPNKVVEAGQPLRDAMTVEATSIALVNVLATAQPQTLMGNLVVGFRLRGVGTGVVPKPVRTTMFLTVDGANNVLACRGATPGAAELCMNNFGGIWDGATQKCDLKVNIPQCPAGQAIVRVVDGVPDCRFPSTASCPPGQVVTGFDLMGNPTCISPTPRLNFAGSHRPYAYDTSGPSSGGASCPANQLVTGISWGGDSGGGGEVEGLTIRCSSF